MKGWPAHQRAAQRSRHKSGGLRKLHRHGTHILCRGGEWQAQRFPRQPRKDRHGAGRLDERVLLGRPLLLGTLLAGEDKECHPMVQALLEHDEEARISVVEIGSEQKFA